ncbi:hypothetical protein NOR_06771 [Metarhizium rileyi]|uniref:Secreted protein NIS1 n=1 Tax=Metarhizium rileyi (strain RCEF 4871) TaxID=1649241 RepID=A0A166ZYU5_METRR|nr:hypothetical protein NOR_06771 [Metarhizium rileyi RCEF 4871]TWU73325.1 hypothetical protein ED733_004542 [Metarhizium rileyi]
MRISTVTSSSSLVALAGARITGISVPSTIRPGDTINATILSSNYIQTVYDVAIVFGYAPGHGTPQSLGLVAESIYLGPAESNKANNIVRQISIPQDAPRGEGLITASLMSLYGALHMPTLTNYNVTVRFADTTSAEYVSSGSRLENKKRVAT